jgi:threonine dehydratase
VTKRDRPSAVGEARPPAATPVSADDVARVRPAVERVASRTPVFNSRFLTELVGGTFPDSGTGPRVVLKAENLQRTGSFKIRGVLAKLSALGDEAKLGIVAASAGNHAQAAAFGAHEAGVPCHVFMPNEASVSKVAATKAYGATVEFGGESFDDCVDKAVERVKETGEILVHAFDDPAIIAGQGTLGLELVEDIGDLAEVLVPLGGGGLASGIAIAVKAHRPEVKVIGVQTASCPSYAGTTESSAPAVVEAVATLADGIAVKRPGEVTLPIVRSLVDEVVTVQEDAIADAMVLLLERAKLVVEGAGAVGAAALLSGVVEAPPKGATAVVLSGGNVDTGLLLTAIRRHETNAGRRLVLLSRVSDRPGQLARLLAVVGGAGGNLVTVDHLREGYDLHVRETAIQLVLETRDPSHARAVLEAARQAGYDVEPVGHPAALTAGGETAR